ncbi:MAG: hypothetical protein AB1782_17720 [Cyanobacteriota bacterium]
MGNIRLGMVISKVDIQSKLQHLCAGPGNTISYYKGLSDNHVNSYDLWNSKAGIASNHSGDFASQLFSTAASEAKLGLDSNKHLVSEICLLENSAFRILNFMGQTTKVSKASQEINSRYAADNLEMINPALASQQRKASEDIKNELADVAAMEAFAQEQVNNLKEMKSIFGQMLGENELLFGKLAQAAEENVVMSQSYSDNRGNVKEEPEKIDPSDSKFQDIARNMKSKDSSDSKDDKATKDKKNKETDRASKNDKSENKTSHTNSNMNHAKSMSASNTAFTANTAIKKFIA